MTPKPTYSIPPLDEDPEFIAAVKDLSESALKKGLAAGMYSWADFRKEQSLAPSKFLTSFHEGARKLHGAQQHEYEKNYKSLTQIQDRKRHEVAASLREINDDIVVNICRAALELSRATNALLKLHAEFEKAMMIEPPDDVMPMLVPRSALLLGSETDPDSDISKLRRQLEERGLI